MKTIREAFSAILPALAVVALTAVFIASVASIVSSLAQRTYEDRKTQHQECVESRMIAFDIAVGTGTLAAVDVFEGRRPPPAIRAEMLAAMEGLRRVKEECPPMPRPYP